MTGSSGQILQEILQPAEVVSVYPLSVKLLKTMAEKIWATSKEETGTIMYFVLRKYQEVPNE